MILEKISPKRSTFLRRNSSQNLTIMANQEDFNSIFMINGNLFITENISKEHLEIKPNDCYMVINNGTKSIELGYNIDIFNHQIIYDPYKFENSEKKNFTADYLKKIYKVPNDYIDVLPKWYSFKFTYEDYNIIFLRPLLGISIQKHEHRNEFWQVLAGKPIIINGRNVHYFVENNTQFEIPINCYHSVINPNVDEFIILKEKWSGEFDEEDINRVFNPNNYK